MDILKEYKMIKIIRNEADYDELRAAVEKFIDLDPERGTPEADQLEILTLLIQQYEAIKFKIDAPSPLEAIRFRMEQLGQAPRDLIPFIGSRSKVSEVLSGKRPLTLSMIRALHAGLGIPAKVLLQEYESVNLNEPRVEWEKFPIREMASRGWFSFLDSAQEELVKHWAENAEDLMHGLLQKIGARFPNEFAVLYKRTEHIRSARSMDSFALAAWTMRILQVSADNPSPVVYHKETITDEFMRSVARLSWSERGPLLAQEFLFKHGISLVIEPHLQRTYLDGAAIVFWKERPVIGLSLRYDRIDNFWFCLMHELAHLRLHLRDDLGQFYDDLDSESGTDIREIEADKLAGEMLIPESDWMKSPARLLSTPQAAQRLASQLQIHPAIVAGRIRHEKNSYRLLNNLIGQGEVRRWFPDHAWKHS